jgi:microcystin-dependent protein
MGNGFILAETGGAEEITLTVSQIPAHSHPFLASSSSGVANQASGKVVAQSPSVSLFVEANTDNNLAPNAIAPVGGSQPHTNFQPYLCINFIISLYGIFPSPT